MISEQMFRLKKNSGPYCNCYCRHPELIENYDKAIADTTQVWEVHHRQEEFYSQKELKERNEYYDVDPEELIFLTKSEHNKINSKCKRQSEARKGKMHSEETKNKMSETRKGKLINHKSLSKRVLCLETGEIFESTKDVQRKTDIFQSNVSAVCHGKLKTAGGNHWKFV